MSLTNTQSNTIQAACCICGHDQFIPGPLGRMAASGLPPKCANCGCLERHRAVRQVYDAIPKDILQKSHVLQFSNDIAAPADLFAEQEISVFGGPNSLDIMSIERADESYDWIIANHVLEHIKDDYVAMRELLRILHPQGVLQLSVPTPSTALETWELDAPDPESFDHWRGYGSDLPLRLAPVLKDAHGLQVIAKDASTGGWDVVYLFTKSHDKVIAIGKALLKAGLPTLKCA